MLGDVRSCRGGWRTGIAGRYAREGIAGGASAWIEVAAGGVRRFDSSGMVLARARKRAGEVRETVGGFVLPVGGAGSEFVIECAAESRRSIECGRYWIVEGFRRVSAGDVWKESGRGARRALQRDPGARGHCLRAARGCVRGGALEFGELGGDCVG